MGEHNGDVESHATPFGGGDSAIRAMNEAIEQATRAAEERAKRKAASKNDRTEHLSPEDRDVLLQTAIHPPVGDDTRDDDIAYLIPRTLPLVEEETHTTGAWAAASSRQDDTLEDLIRQASADLPEVQNREDYGDLVLIKHEAPSEAWYTQASEQALPGVLRSTKGPVDLKMLVQALMIEVGDVKRTNAAIMETLARIEEKVERTNRHLRDRRSFKP